MDNRTINTEYEELIIRYYSDDISLDEQMHLLDLVSTNEDVAAVFKQYSSIKTSVGRSGTDYKPAYEEFLQLVGTEGEAPKSRKIFYTIVAAASILILIAVTFMWNSQQKAVMSNSITASFNVVDTILPDKSEVSLNKGTEIRFAESFTQERTILLNNGEAYFEVQPDNIHPFVVKSANAMITVLGTGFNVKIDSLSGDITVTVLHGKVHVCSNEDRVGVILTKNQKTVLGKASTSFSDAIAANENELSWKRNELIFKSTPMPDVVRAINNHFGSNLLIDGTTLDSCRLNASFPQPDLDNILEMLKIAFDMKIESNENVQVLKGGGC